MSHILEDSFDGYLLVDSSRLSIVICSFLISIAEVSILSIIGREPYFHHDFSQEKPIFDGLWSDLVIRDEVSILDTIVIDGCSKIQKLLGARMIEEDIDGSSGRVSGDGRDGDCFMDFFVEVDGVGVENMSEYRQSFEKLFCLDFETPIPVGEVEP